MKNKTLQRVSHTVFNKQTFGKHSKLLIAWVVFTAVIILTGKVFFVDSHYLFLYIYGISVSAVLILNIFVAIFLYEDPALVAAEIQQGLVGTDDEVELPMVSCMVAVFNEEEEVEKCILSLINQTYQNKEVIFVNDGSTDGTAEILDKYAEKGLIRAIHQENAGKKRALGNAMRIAKGEIYAMSDSDSLWAPDAIEKIAPVFAIFPEVGAVSGHFRLTNANTNILTKAQDAWAEGQFAIRKAFESYYGAVACVSGPLAVFRKSAIYNFIPSWEQDTFLGQEFRFATDRTMTGYMLGAKYIGREVQERYIDPDFQLQAKYPNKDWLVLYTKSARAWTILPDNMKVLMKQQIRWKKSFIRSSFFVGRFYWHKPILPTLVYYLHILFVVLGPFVAFRHLIYLPINGDIFAGIIYLIGIIFIGFTFGFMYKLENPDSHIWIYRPVMSLLSALVLSWVIFYSALTIKNMTWYRG